MYMCECYKCGPWDLANPGIAFQSGFGNVFQSGLDLKSNPDFIQNPKLHFYRDKISGRLHFCRDNLFNIATFKGLY